MIRLPLLLAAALLPLAAGAHDTTGHERPRARDAGIVIGTLPTGPLNAIVDVEGVAVGHATLDDEDGTIRTGVTAILPHGGDLFHERVPAAIHVANGFGKLLGVTQVRELGELETPVLLTGTLGVWQAADAMVEWLLARPGMEQVRSINPVVGETNDGFLNDIRARPLQAAHVRAALAGASTSKALTSTTVPASGILSSPAALTDSMTAASSPWAKLVSTSGNCTKTMSPSAFCA